MEIRIVTFSCQDSVYVYYDGCGRSPTPPCNFHPTIQKAIDYLKSRGVENPRVIEIQIKK